MWPIGCMVCHRLSLQKEERQRKTNTQKEQGANAPLVFSLLKTVISAIRLTPRILLQALLRSQLLSNWMTYFFYQIQHKTLRKKNRRRYFNWSSADTYLKTRRGTVLYTYQMQKNPQPFYTNFSLFPKCVQFSRSRKSQHEGWLQWKRCKTT